MGRENLKWCQIAHHQLINQPNTHFSPHRTAKTNDKSKITGRMVFNGISYVETASVHSEKTHLKQLRMMMKMIIINPQRACARGLQ